MECFLILALSKSVFWINENVLGAHGNNLAQRFSHLKETQGEKRVRGCARRRIFQKGYSPPWENKSNNNLTLEFLIKADLHN